MIHAEWVFKGSYRWKMSVYYVLTKGKGIKNLVPRKIQDWIT